MKGADGVEYYYALHIYFEKSIQSLAEIEVFDTGKPISEAVSVDIPSKLPGLLVFCGTQQPTLQGAF